MLTKDSGGVKKEVLEGGNQSKSITVDVGDEDDSGLGPGGAGDVRLEPAEAVDDLALPASGVQRRRVRAALRACHSPPHLTPIPSSVNTVMGRTSVLAFGCKREEENAGT